MTSNRWYSKIILKIIVFQCFNQHFSVKVRTQEKILAFL